MNRGLYFAIFIAGATVGSAVTWYCVKKKYEKIAQDEINSVKEVFTRREPDEEMAAEVNDTIRHAADRAKEKPDVVEYAALVHKYNGNMEKEQEEGVREKRPYVIPPEEFGRFDDYEEISLTYYADGILADDNDEVLDDAEGIVGDALNHFGEYEDDSVFVRCDERKCDYEILLDQRIFSEAADSNPRQVEV